MQIFQFSDAALTCSGLIARWAQGKLRPFTFQRFPLSQASEAHRLMESSAHIGKILLVP